MRVPKWKKERPLKKILFEEVVSRTVCKDSVLEHPKISETHDSSPKNYKSEDNGKISKKKGQKKQKFKQQEGHTTNEKESSQQKMEQQLNFEESHEENRDHEKTLLIKEKKRKRKQLELQSEDTSKANGEENGPKTEKKEESIRAKKRKKHAQLLEEKKIQTELALQEKSLNYLSKWKHCRDEWKFEKLKQIWLQHNMYDTNKIPEDFWDVLVEYFSNSKGKARDIILKHALKIIEEYLEEDSANEIKIKRARDIIQNLQE